MKKRILFVDDETLVLQGLQRMLHSMRGEWEMVFVESGAQALEAMACSPFDVVVSDMRMPGMSGAELMGRVMQLYPGTMRMILSGHADNELILQCVGSTHQFLAKPCDPDAIKDALRRAGATDDALQNATLKRLVGQMSHLPSVPSLYSEIIEALRDPEVSIEVIGAIIAKDIAMTAQILKLVNSAFFGLRRQVSSPAEAANFLGVATIRSLALSIDVFSQFESEALKGFSFSELWAHSLDTGAAARSIARCQGSAPKLVDEAFVAGLLHDTGKIILAANFASGYAEVLGRVQREGIDQGEAERRVFGVSHAEVGGYLLGLWSLPVPVVEAIAFHHRPSVAGEQSFSPLAALHVANAFVHWPAEKDISVPNPRIDHDYLTAVGVAPCLADWWENYKNDTSERKSE